MKHLKIYESFSEIEKLCKKYHIKNFKINLDGTVDVNGDIDSNEFNGHTHEENWITKLPIKFNRITGDFYCTSNKNLKTMEKFPFICWINI